MREHTATGGAVPDPSVAAPALAAVGAGHLLLVRRVRRRSPALPALAPVLSAPVALLLRVPPRPGPVWSSLWCAAGSRGCPPTRSSPWRRARAVPYPLYFTPLFNASVEHPAGHRPLHAHFLLPGRLLAYVIAGPATAPPRCPRSTPAGPAGPGRRSRTARRTERPGR
ncbi:cytochrome c oxidase assembly protein [Streptomyces sp. JNUCC 63]